MKSAERISRASINENLQETQAKTKSPHFIVYDNETLNAPLLIRGEYPVDAYEFIGKKIEKLAPGEFISYVREIQGTNFRMDFYPKGLMARKDVPQKLKLVKDYKNRYSYLWKPDIGAYNTNENIPGKKVLEEVVQLDLALDPNDHAFRFLGQCMRNVADREYYYRLNALNNYTNSRGRFLLTRNPGSNELLGIVGCIRNQRDKTSLELGMEVAEKARGLHIAETSIEDLSGILSAYGSAVSIEGIYLFTRGNYNERCDSLFKKKQTEVSRGNSHWKSMELWRAPEEPELKRFKITI